MKLGEVNEKEYQEVCQVLGGLSSSTTQQRVYCAPLSEKQLIPVTQCDSTGRAQTEALSALEILKVH